MQVVISQWSHRNTGFYPLFGILFSIIFVWPAPALNLVYLDAFVAGVLLRIYDFPTQCDFRLQAILDFTVYDIDNIFYCIYKRNQWFYPMQVYKIWERWRISIRKLSVKEYQTRPREDVGKETILKKKRWTGGLYNMQKLLIWHIEKLRKLWVGFIF